MANTLESAALNYAKAGLRVFPLTPNSKKPFIKWKNEATTEAEKIKAWWQSNPDYNVAICCGNGLLVVDVDVKHGKNGLESWEKYCSNFPKTMAVKTPTGGLHYYYFVKNSADYKNIADLHPGIDIRTDGGYIVAPSSYVNFTDKNGDHIEGSYECINNEPIAEANQAVYDFLNGALRNSDENYLHIDNTINQGSRNDILFRLASSLQAKNLSDDAIYSAVMAENNAKCNPPLSDQEVRSIINSALKYSKGTNQKPVQKKKLSLELTRLSDVKEKNAEWLIWGYIPKGNITTICGDGGAGKTTVWCNIVASLSSGKRCFFEVDEASRLETREPKKIMFFSAEDDLQTTLKKRLKINNANMDNIFTIPIDDERFQYVKYDNEFLKDLIEEINPELLLFDPLQGFTPSNVNMSYRNAMRNLLAPLVGFGAKYGVTTIIICHTNKRANAYGRNRMADTGDIWDISRSVFIIGDTGQDGIRYFSHEKCNYGQLMETTLFEIEDGQPKYIGNTNKKDREYVTERTFQKQNSGAKDEAITIILDYIKENGGKVENGELKEYCLSCGISVATFGRAKAELKSKKFISITSIGFGKDKKTFIADIVST